MAAGFLFTITLALVNGRDLISALKAGLILILLVCGVCIPILWGIEIASKKGYPAWLAGILVLCFNILGLVIVILLPIPRMPKRKLLIRHACVLPWSRTVLIRYAFLSVVH